METLSDCLVHKLRDAKGSESKSCLFFYNFSGAQSIWCLGLTADLIIFCQHEMSLPTVAVQPCISHLRVVVTE